MDEHVVGCAIRGQMGSPGRVRYGAHYCANKRRHHYITLVLRIISGIVKIANFVQNADFVCAQYAPVFYCSFIVIFSFVLALLKNTLIVKYN